jgi:hypothetical protein
MVMKNNKGISSTILALIIRIICIACAAGFYFLKISKKGNPLNSPQTAQNIVDNSTIKKAAISLVCDSNSPSTIRIVSPNGGEVFEAGQQIVVKWKSCNVTPESVGIFLKKYNSILPYAQSEQKEDLLLPIARAKTYTDTPDISFEKITLPPTKTPGFVKDQQYYIGVSGLGDNTHIGTGYAPTDYSDNLFVIR